MGNDRRFQGVAEAAERAGEHCTCCAHESAPFVHRVNFVQVLDSITEKMFDGPQPENPRERLKILRGPDQRERTVLLCNAALCLALNVSEVSGYYSVSDRRNSH